MARHANPRSRRSWSNYGLCCTGFRASITERPRTSAQDRRRNAKWRAGEGQRGAPILTYGRGTPVSAQACDPHAPPLAQAPGWGGVSFFAQAPSSARVPAFPEARRDTKGCRESAERGRGLWSDFGSQTTWSGFSGAGSGLTGTAGLVPPYVPFPSFPCSNGLAGRIGYTGRRRWSRWEHEHPPSSFLRPNGGADSVSEPAEPRTPEGQPMAPLPSLVLYPSRSPGARRW